MFTLPLPIQASSAPYQRPFVQSGAISLPIAVTNVWSTICAETMLQTERGVVGAVGLDINNNGSEYEWQLGSIAYRITVAGGVPIDWGSPDVVSGALLTSKRGSVVNPTQTYFLLQPGQQIQLQVRRVAATDSGPSRTIYGILSGIRWPNTINKDAKPTDGPIDMEVAKALPYNL